MGDTVAKKWWRWFSLLRKHEALGLASLMLVAVAGCTSSAGPASSSAATSYPTGTISAYQRSLLAKPPVTAADYEAAFTAFQKCADSGGGSVIVMSRDPVSGEITYETSGQIGTPENPDLTTPEGRCYHKYFDRVEIVFETTNPVALQEGIRQQVQIYDQSIRPCLLKNHETAPRSVTPGSQSFGQLMDAWSKLNAEGKCRL